MNYIHLQPMGEIPKELLRYLGSQLEELYHHPFMVAPYARVPQHSYEPDRNQYNASILLSKLGEKIPSKAVRVLGAVDVDLYVPGLHFVFGIASDKAAVISITRLRPEYYGEKRNEFLLRERALKEAIHELGHTFGMDHCPDIRCIMHFSNCIEDTDRKGPDFCEKCSPQLKGI